MTLLQTCAVEFVYFYAGKVKILEAVEVDHGHVIAVAVVTMSIRLDTTYFAERVVNMVFVKVVRRLDVCTTEEGKIGVWYKGE